jgi:hypothetical protein
VKVETEVWLDQIPNPDAELRRTGGERNIPMTLTDELIERFNKMDEAQQQRLLNFARILIKTPVVKGESGVSIAGATGFFDAQSLDEMEAAIAEGCEEIDWCGWE